MPNILPGLPRELTWKTLLKTGAGNSAIWTPAAGNFFHLVAYVIVITNESTLAAGAAITIKFQDGAVDIPGLFHTVFVPTAAGPVDGPLFNTGLVMLGNGIRSAAVNNVLNLNLGTALVTGGCRAMVGGYEG